MADYQNTTIRLNNAGILLRDDAELLKEGNFLRLQNVRSTFEGSLTGRAGRSIEVTVPNAGVIHTIRRVDQDHLFIGSRQRGYSNNVLLSTVPFHFLPLPGDQTLDDAVEEANSPTVVTVRPDGQGADNTWTTPYPAAKWEILASADGVRYVAALPTPETYTFSNLSIDVNSTISKLRLVTRASAAQGDNIVFRARLNGVVTESGFNLGSGVYNNGNPYLSVSEFAWDEVEKPGGGNWTVADINDAEFGFSIHNWIGTGPLAHNEPFHTALSLEVTYTAPTPTDPPSPWDVFSGNSLTTVPFTPLVGNRQWLYIGDSRALYKTAGQPIEGIGEPGHTALLLKWGVDAPTGDFPSPPVVLNDVPGGLNSNALGATVYDWRYTYYSSATGAESNPNDEMGTGASVVNKSVRLTANLSLDPQVDKVRFYRRGGTIATAGWRLVGAADNPTNNPPPNTVVTFVDGISDQDALAAQVLLQDNFVPFPSENQEGDAVYGVPMPSVWGPFAGSYIMGCGDTNRPGHAYWTNPNRPDSADIANHVFVTPATEPLINGFIYGGGNYVWSQDNLYKLEYNGPAGNPTFVPTKTAVGRGTVGRLSFAVGHLIWFVHGSGIYETDGTTPPVSITELSIRPLFENRGFGGLEPIDFDNAEAIKLTYRGAELHFHYIGTNGTRHHLLYDLVYKRWVQDTTQGFQEVMFYADENTAQDTLLIGTTIGTVVNADGGTVDEGLNGSVANINSLIQTGRIDLGATNTMKDIGALLLDWSVGTTQVSTANLAVTVLTDFDTPLTATPTQFLSMPVGGAMRDKTPISLSLTPSSDPFVPNLDSTQLLNFGLLVQWSGPYSTDAPRLFSLEVLWRPDEEQLVFWTSRETSHGMRGWQMLRDIFLSTFSPLPLQLTIYVDGVPYVYDIPAQGLEPSNPSKGREKTHIWIDPIKGKIFKYELRLVGNPSFPRGFRLYGEDCEVNVKSWNSVMGYQNANPFIPSR